MEWLQSVKELFYPRLCLSCGEWLIKEEEGLCLICTMQLPKSKFKLNDTNPIAEVLWGRVPLKYASSFLLLNRSNMTHNILHSIKYKGNKDLAEYMGKLYARDIIGEGHFLVDGIIPVPLHPIKKRQRGYNQADEFGIGLGYIFEKPCYGDGLKRVRYTETQTKKNREDRWENVSDIFELSPMVEVKGKHILLVDDVITTGATLESCARVILSQGPASLGVLTLAFAKG